MANAKQVLDVQVSKGITTAQSNEHQRNRSEKAEKYAKILSKTIINPEGDSFGQNAFFYDSAEGLLTAVILLLAEFLPPREIGGQLQERRHIVSCSSWYRTCWNPPGPREKAVSKC